MEHHSASTDPTQRLLGTETRMDILHALVGILHLVLFVEIRVFFMQKKICSGAIMTSRVTVVCRATSCTANESDRDSLGLRL
jgi:hypothetical protein